MADMADEMPAALELHARLAPRPDAGATDPGAGLRPGDIADLTLSVTVGSGTRVTWPVRADLDRALTGRAVVVDDGTATPPRPADVPGVPAGLGLTLEKTWRVQVLAPPGDHELGPFEVGLAVGADGAPVPTEVPGVTLQVRSVLSAETQDAFGAAEDPGALQALAVRELAPVRGPWTLAGPTPVGLVVGGAAGLLVAALLFWWAFRRWRRRAHPVAARPLELAEREARRRLDALLQGEALDRGEHLAFHVEVADALKTYLGRRYGADFVDRTTAEIRRLLHQELAPAPGLEGVRREVLEVLTGCDLVKFARVVPDREESLGRARAARSVVDSTTEAVAQAEVDARARVARESREKGAAA